MKIAKVNDINESDKYETRCDDWRMLVYSSATSCRSKACTLTLLLTLFFFSVFPARAPAQRASCATKSRAGA
jgi:hypothetical protein